MSTIKSISPNSKVTGPVHHIYPKTSPPKRYYFGAPTPEMTPESSEAGDSVKLAEVKAPPPLDLPLRLSLTRSQESNHGSAITSTSPHTGASTSSEESALVQQLHNRIPKGPAPDVRRKKHIFGSGRALPYSIREEDERDAASSSHSIRSILKNAHQKSAASSSTLFASEHVSRPNVMTRASRDRSFKKRQSFRKRVRRIFGGGKGGIKGGDRMRH
ncbi:hypothetical protein JR316_0008698 [Psilocybe cubensis]|uniref:Uncharacterized protein n=2 Tax=Psilocybe cubensis TaxID=181762 RepID=A0ACB8GRZ3_PSICU|nr:hypothetical protein JR316_0008698 [Psilocybe cubensis]KAH9478245.1 hypothetical protein JR316_0008698 [Psilocybe cubensis]